MYTIAYNWVAREECHSSLPGGERVRVSIPPEGRSGPYPNGLQGVGGVGVRAGGHITVTWVGSNMTEDATRRQP